LDIVPFSQRTPTGVFPQFRTADSSAVWQALIFSIRLLQEFEELFQQFHLKRGL